MGALAPHVNVQSLHGVTGLTNPVFSHFERVACSFSSVVSRTIMLPTVPRRVPRHVRNRVTSHTGHPIA